MPGHRHPEGIATRMAGLALRRLVPGPPDWRLMAAWLSDPRVLEWYEGRDKPFDYAKAAQKWSEEAVAAENLDCRIIEYHGHPVGYLQFYPVAKAEDYELESAENTWAADIFLGQPDQWSRGLGTAALGAVVEYLFIEGVAKVVIDPRLDNPRAIRAYEKIGFTKVKVLKEHEEHEGARRDCWLMELQPPAIPGTR